MVLHEDAVLEPGIYHLPFGITIAKPGVTLDGNGATIIGSSRQDSGVTVEADNVTVKNLKVREYYHGIRAEGVSGLTLQGNQIQGTAEIRPNTIFLDIWRTADDSYGGAMMLNDVRDSLVEDNDLQHNMNGLLSYSCTNLTVRQNQANYCSGYGIHLHGTSDSVFEENSCDYCCRFEPREGGIHYGHMGADATGFLIVHGSCRNKFLRNTARLGGDGFFVAGLGPNGEKAGCDENLFEENDASLSPNIAFECTFSRGNVFRNNFADRCNFGFWLGWSWDTVVEGNRMVMNRQAGIAVENGRDFVVRGNTFQANGHGILAWSHESEKWIREFPEHCTSHDWLIEENTMTRNGKAIRIAADQDHGIRRAGANPGPAVAIVDGEAVDRGGAARSDASRPHSFTIRKNDIQDNAVGIELVRADGVRILENIINRNLEANLRQDDCEAAFYRNNLGSVGAYL
jgi:parallel beta-helix repeat protein